ncbi:hypothetical protein BOX15_Mlig029251g2 [Macrostomum lignano]|uniref:Ig-like domain-containing protein n=1 Tax=Macrostomum lignano TaxID=282301 RepID=A0A267DVN5_9PLAT|nr:hypothetical protein BOX15_Mlig029251g2 [Macrostomum lignano]
MVEKRLYLTVFLQLASLALAVSASVKIVGHNATVPVEKTETSVFNRYKLGPELQIKSTNEDLSISCELVGTSELKDPKISLQTLGDASLQPAVASELSGDKKTFRAKVTLSKSKLAKASAYTCAGESNGQKFSTTIAFLSVPLLRLSIEGGGYEKEADREAYAKQADLPAIHGSRLSVTCEVRGYPTAEVTWFKIQLVDKQRQEVPVGKGDKLEFAKLDYHKHRSQYVCRAKNDRGKNSLNIYLRVKHPRAYLVPLIVLIIQLVIIVAIYIVYELSIYEKRWRAARREAEEEEERLEFEEFDGGRGSTLSLSAGQAGAGRSGPGVDTGVVRSVRSSRISSNIGRAKVGTEAAAHSSAKARSSARTSIVAAAPTEAGASKAADKPAVAGSKAVKTQPNPSVRI